MKVHVGTDTRGVVHSLVTTDAAQADINQLPELIHSEEKGDLRRFGLPKRGRQALVPGGGGALPT